MDRLIYRRFSPNRHARPPVGRHIGSDQLTAARLFDIPRAVAIHDVGQCGL